MLAAPSATSHPPTYTYTALTLSGEDRAGRRRCCRQQRLQRNKRQVSVVVLSMCGTPMLSDRHVAPCVCCPSYAVMPKARHSTNSTARRITSLPFVSQLVVTASFLGVGAPEAVLVGVVALVVFGPKGLAEVHSEPKPIFATISSAMPCQQHCSRTKAEPTDAQDSFWEPGRRTSRHITVDSLETG